MEITRVIRPDLMPGNTNDKTMMALDEGMEMTIAIPSKKLAQNKTAVAAPSDCESASQELEFTRAALSSHRPITTTGSVSNMELTHINVEGTDERCASRDCTVITELWSTVVKVPI